MQCAIQAANYWRELLSPVDDPFGTNDSSFICEWSSGQREKYIVLG